MLNSVLATAEKSNPAPARLGGGRNEMGRTLLAVNALLRKKFGNKTWASVAFLLKIEERTARHRLAGTRQYDFADVVNLLRSKDGFDILKAMMGEPKQWPSWFKIVIAQIKQAKAMTDVRHAQLAFEEWQQEAAAQTAKLAEDA